MDPVTHALSGMVIHQFGFRKKAALFVLVFSAVVPDIDYVTRFWGADTFLAYHRGITHGVLALFLFPLLMGFIFRNKGGFLYYYVLSFLGYGAHLFLDLTNQYGTMILSPLDWNRYSLDLTFVIDQYISAGLLLAVVFGRMNKKRSALIAVSAVLLISCYLGGRFYMQGQARQFLKTKLDANIYRVYPIPNGFLRWWFTVKTGDVVSTGCVDLFMKKVFVYEKYKMPEADAAVTESRSNRTVQDFMSFAYMPHAEVSRENDRTTVVWRDLAFSYLPGDRFSAVVVTGKDGKVLQSYFRY